MPETTLTTPWQQHMTYVICLMTYDNAIMTYGTLLWHAIWHAIMTRDYDTLLWHAMTPLWHLYDTSMTPLWHLYDTLWHPYDTSMTRYDTCAHAHCEHVCWECVYNEEIKYEYKLWVPEYLIQSHQKCQRDQQFGSTLRVAELRERALTELNVDPVNTKLPRYQNVYSNIYWLAHFLQRTSEVRALNSSKPIPNHRHR